MVGTRISSAGAPNSSSFNTFLTRHLRCNTSGKLRAALEGREGGRRVVGG